VVTDVDVAPSAVAAPPAHATRTLRGSRLPLRLASVPWPAKLRAIAATTAAHAHQAPTPRMEEKIMNCSSLLQKKKKKKTQEESAATAETTNGFYSETRRHTEKVRERERRGGGESTRNRMPMPSRHFSPLKSYCNTLRRSKSSGL
jgi:hypothetical protein